MGTAQAVRDAYQRALPVLEELERYVRFTLEPYVARRGYIFKGRVKSLESVSEKIDTGRFSAWSDLDDLYAASVVVPVVSHENEVLRQLDACFETLTVKSRQSAEKTPEEFRFDGVRWYGRVRAQAAQERIPGLADVVFEIQVPTAFEHAWQVVTHDLVYKADNVDWARLRLAAQLKAAVEQIEMVIGTFESAAGAVPVSPWKVGALQGEIIDEFKQLQAERIVPGTLVPTSWRRFAESVYRIARTEALGSTNEERVRGLLELVNRRARTGDTAFAVAGTLVQYVYAALAAEGHTTALAGLPVPDSPELTEIYGVVRPGLPFVFDGSAAVAQAHGPGADGDEPDSEAGDDPGAGDQLGTA